MMKSPLIYSFLVVCCGIFQAQAQFPEKIITDSDGQSSVTNLVVVDSKLFFVADDDAIGRELWYLEDDLLTTFDIRQGAIGSFPDQFIQLGDMFLFTAYDTIHGRDLWIYKDDTIQALDITPGIGGCDFSDAVLFDNAIYFRASDGQFGHELWKHDGDELTLFDLQPGAESSFPLDLQVIGDTLYFSMSTDSTGRELCRFVNDLPQLFDVIPGTEESYPSVLGSLFGRIYFEGDSDEHGRELWVLENDSTFEVADVYSGASSSGITGFRTLNSSAVFLARASGVGTELWSISENYELTLFDLTEGPSSSSGLSNFYVFNDTYFFSAKVGNTGQHLWACDGEDTISYKLNDDYSTDPSWFTTFENQLIFSASGGSYGEELWRFDGQEFYVTNLQPNGNSSVPSYFKELNGELYFSAKGRNAVGRELWKLNKSFDTILVAKNPDNSLGFSFVGNMTLFDNDVYFVGNDGSGHNDLYRVPAIVTQVENSISNLESLITTIYPNPIDKGFFKLTNASGVTDLSVVDQFGEVIPTAQDFRNSEISIEFGGKVGVYFVSVSLENGYRETHKLIVVH